jgi:hypothetical protein
VELDQGFALHLVHVAGIWMIAQGMDGLSREIYLKGVMAGDNMLPYVDLAKGVLERQPVLINYVTSWTKKCLGRIRVLSPKDWFDKGHGVEGRTRDINRVWIPNHAKEGKAYLWSPPPISADIALECLKAVRKRTDVYHIFMILRLYSPVWLRMFYKLSEFVFKLTPGSPHWPAHMHEPLFVGISLPLARVKPWSLHRLSVPVDLERKMQEVQNSNQGDEWDILLKLLQITKRLPTMPQELAWKNRHKCLVIGKFPLKVTKDAEGNPWFQQSQGETRYNHCAKGAHAWIPLQCEDCRMINLEGWLPVPNLDDMYVMLLRRANLDAMLGCAVSTTEAHAAAVQHTVRLCKLICKNPTVSCQGPMEAGDLVGMSTAVDMLMGVLVGKPRIKGEQHIQFNLMCKVQGTFKSAWESSPREILEGLLLSTGFGKTILTQCPTQQKWFGMFLQGSEIQMGYATQANRPLSTNTIVKLLKMVREEAEVEEVSWISCELFKFGAAVVRALCGCRRGPEVFRLDLAGIRENIRMGKEGILPSDPMKAGVNLSNTPYIFIALLGKFKGETRVRQYIVVLTTTTKSGIETRWWLEKLIGVQFEEGCTSSPSFGYPDGLVAAMMEYDDILHQFLVQIQQENSSLISENNDVQAHYSLFCSFRKTAEGRA